MNLQAAAFLTSAFLIIIGAAGILLLDNLIK